MDVKLRHRKADFPRTYFFLKKGKDYFLLFWIEYGKDNSIYLWFSDDTNKFWEVTAKHSQPEIAGLQEIDIKVESLNIFDPHISWHQSGQVHVRGYNNKDQMGEVVISNKKSHTWKEIENGHLTVPISQIIFPVIAPELSLVYVGKMPIDFPDDETMLATIDRNGYSCVNNGANKSAYIIIDSVLIPKNFELGIDLQIHKKTDPVELLPTSPKELVERLIFPKALSLFKEKTSISVCARFFKVDNNNPKSKPTSSITATCFNQETIEIFQLKQRNN